MRDRLRLIDEGLEFIDRAAETAALEQAWADAADGLRMALIGGEPGIGKTRLAAHLARIVDAEGGMVLYGRSDSELAIPAQPFAEAFAQYVADVDDGELAELGDSASVLARIVPSLTPHAPDERGAVSGPIDQHELFHAGARLLAVASRRRRLLVIVDDVHWADRPTALLLRYLLTSPEPIRALVVATYRTTELEPESSVASALLDLERHPNVIGMILEGLDLEDSVALAGEIAGHRLEGAERTLAEMVHAETAGNPLFATQILRSLAEAGSIDRVAGRWSLRRQIATADLPGSVTETLRGRVQRLGEGVFRILSAASVIGSEFEIEPLVSVSEADPDAVEAALDRAAGAGIVARGDGGGPFGFTHPLIPRVLYEGIGSASRGAAHRRAALAIEELAGSGARSRASELARHWLEALPGDADRAREWCRRAGQEALEQFEADAAVRWFTRALEVEGQVPGSLECDLLIGLGIAQRASGQPAFRETLLSASRLASEIEDAGRLVESAIANNRGFASASGTVDQERIAMLELALERTGDGDSEERAQLLATLAAELSFSGEWDRRVELSDEALAIARRLGDEHVLSSVLTARFVPIWMPETLEERLANSEENVRLADRVGRPLEQFGAIHWHSVALVQAGRIEEAVEAIEREDELARRLGDPTALWISTYDRGNLAIIFGRLDEAESLANEAFQIASASGQPDALSFFGSQIANVRYEQGRLAELQELLAQVVAENPGIPAFRAVLALAYAESGLRNEACELLGMELESSFEEIPRDVTWLAGHAIYAHVCADLDEPAPAELLYERIAPFGAQVVYTGISAWSDGDHALGRLATTLGRHDDAERHLEASRARARSIGAPAWAVRTGIDTARLLLRRCAPEDPARATGLLVDAAADARRLGIGQLAGRAENLAAHARAQGVIGTTSHGAARLRLRHRAAATVESGEAPGDTEARQPRHATLRCEGDTWSLSWRGETLRLRDVKGVRYLATLLADPGVERHAVDLQRGPTIATANGVDTGASELSVRAAAEDAGAVLDPRAKREYRERIDELRAEIEEAEGFNDPERAAHAREELEFLGRELAAAVGIGGRDRKAASTSERARINVTRAIRKTVQRIAELDPHLGEHFERSLRTGSFCVYEPKGADAPNWSVEGPAS